METYLVAVLKELIDVLTSTTIITTTEKKMSKSSERLCSFSRRVQKDGTRLSLRMEITLVSFVNLCKTFLNLKCYFVTSLMEKQSERHDRNVRRVNDVFVDWLSPARGLPSKRQLMIRLHHFRNNKVDLFAM